MTPCWVGHPVFGPKLDLHYRNCSDAGTFAPAVVSSFPITREELTEAFCLETAIFFGSRAPKYQLLMLPRIRDRFLVYHQNSVRPRDCRWAAVRNHHHRPKWKR